MKVCNKAQSYLEFLRQKIVNLEIVDINIEIKFIENKIKLSENKIIALTSQEFFNNILNYHKYFLNNYTKNLINNSMKKFNFIKTKQQALSPLITNTKDWLINKTNVTIPENVKEILSLGGKFATVYDKTNLPISKIIANIENGIYSIPFDTKYTIRNNVVY